MPPTIEQVIAAIPDWAGRTVTAERIPAGLTNTNYRVEVDGTPYFVRIPGAGDRAARGRSRQRAAQHARGGRGRGGARGRPRTCPTWDVFVLDWLPAPDDVERDAGGAGHAGPDRRRPPPAPRRAPLPRRLRHGPASPSATSRSSTSGRSRSRPATASTSGRCRGSRPRWRRNAPPSVPCHNDLLADNYLDDGERLWLVDWEYSGNNDPAFELGNTAQELGYDDARQAELCAAYFGEASPALLARMRLQMIMSDVGWTLWAAIQARISTDRLRLHRLGRGALGARHRDARRPRLRGLADGRQWARRPLALLPTGAPTRPPSLAAHPLAGAGRPGRPARRSRGLARRTRRPRGRRPRPGRRAGRRTPIVRSTVGP